MLRSRLFGGRFSVGESLYSISIMNLITSIILTCSAFIAVIDGYKYETLYYTQKVDHFGYSNGDFFKQRYLINLDYYTFGGNGSVFVYAGNEGDIEMFANNTGFMWEHASKFNAAVVFLEHRYYGESLPYGDLSYKNKSYLGYLTSEQALADFATLITFLKSHIPHADKAPFIVFGGSYGGMLAVYFRIKYPHLVNGAIASSAPIVQFGDLTPCNKFAEIATQDFKMEGSECPESIRKSWGIIRRLYNEAGGMEFLFKTFHLCENFKSFKVDELISWLSDTWGYLAMTNYPYPTDFLAPLPAHPIKVVCANLQNSSVPERMAIINIYKAVSVFYNYTGAATCFDLTKSGGQSLGQDGWNFQACTEMVTPLCQTGITDMFEPVQWNLTSYVEDCMNKYGVSTDPMKPILMYGGKDIAAASNIVFTNGLLDPWYGGGILKSLSDSLIAIVIENAAHHLDLRSSNPADPTSVKTARLEMLKWINRWILEARRSD